MSAREDILSAIRTSLGPDAPGRDPEAVDVRLARHAAGLQPTRAQSEGENRVAQFIEWAEFVATTVDRVASLDDVPGAVTSYLSANNLPAKARRATDASLDGIPWERTPLLELEPGVAVDSDAVSITGAFAGIAETGTLMLNSGPGHPSTLNSLPETHLVVLRRDQLVGGYDDAWNRLRQSGGALPRTVLLVTGPSRSGDIEQTLQLGAHGPKRLHIVLVDGEETADA
ncbi:MAG: LUD domain-containing protein [Alphaproteobacteria bacterium]